MIWAQKKNLKKKKEKKKFGLLCFVLVRLIS